jgi:hypothetical protein
LAGEAGATLRCSSRRFNEGTSDGRDVGLGR